MSEKVSLTAEQLAPIVHEALAGLIKSMNESGAPPLVIAGELLKLGAEWFIQEEGKLAAQQNVRKLLHQYFEGVTDQREAENSQQGRHAPSLTLRTFPPLGCWLCGNRFRIAFVTCSERDERNRSTRQFIRKAIGLTPGWPFRFAPYVHNEIKKLLTADG
jgi:hypothetical protein